MIPRLASHPSTDPVTRAQVLSRAVLQAGGVEALLRKDAPEIRLFTECEREQSLRNFLSSRPSGPLWLFGYGSLMWNPAIHVAGQRAAKIVGWHRSFCLSAIAGRGVANAPGLFLGLDHGGSCTGLAFHIAEDDIESELPLVWMREMMMEGYVPRWVEVLDEAGEAFGVAVAFTIDGDSELYAGDLPTDTVVERLATAVGGFGTAADYLFNTRNRLRDLCIADPVVECLAQGVQTYIAAQSLRQAA